MFMEQNLSRANEHARKSIKGAESQHVNRDSASRDSCSAFSFPRRLSRTQKLWTHSIKNGFLGGWHDRKWTLLSCCGGNNFLGFAWHWGQLTFNGARNCFPLQRHPRIICVSREVNKEVSEYISKTNKTINHRRIMEWQLHCLSLSLSRDWYISFCLSIYKKRKAVFTYCQKRASYSSRQISCPWLLLGSLVWGFQSLPVTYSNAKQGEQQYLVK